MKSSSKNQIENNTAKNSMNQSNNSQHNNYSNCNQCGPVEPLPESSRPRRDGPGGEDAK